MKGPRRRRNAVFVDRTLFELADAPSRPSRGVALSPTEAAMYAPRVPYQIMSDPTVCLLGLRACTRVRRICMDGGAFAGQRQHATGYRITYSVARSPDSHGTISATAVAVPRSPCTGYKTLEGNPRIYAKPEAPRVPPAAAHYTPRLSPSVAHIFARRASYLLSALYRRAHDFYVLFYFNFFIYEGFFQLFGEIIFFFFIVRETNIQ